MMAWAVVFSGGFHFNELTNTNWQIVKMFVEDPYAKVTSWVLVFDV
ncbi:MAG: hypothetical protein ACKOX6_02410 [Bdellovibrio sp.]